MTDPVALRSPFLCWFFTGVMRRQMGRHFRAVRLARPGLPALPPGRPVVVVTMHPSWWDPALLMLLMRRFPGRAGFGPMEEEALARYAFFRRIGIFGVEESRAGAVRFLQTSARVLGDPSRMLWVTAQGRFADPRERPLSLRPGVAHVLARNPHAVAVPLALEYPFWTEKRPEALAAFGEPVEPGADAADWGRRLEAALTATADRLQALALARDPAAFEPVLRGRAGVGGVWGAWQRSQAALRGRRHVPDHVPDHIADHS